MITITISLKAFMIVLASLSIYITVNLWVVNYINNKLSSKIKNDNIYPFIDLGTHKFKYMFLSIFLLFNQSDILKEAIYEHNCKRLKMLKDLSYIYSGEEFDLERSELVKDIHKYEVYKKLKSLDNRNIFNRKR